MCSRGQPLLTPGALTLQGDTQHPTAWHPPLVWVDAGGLGLRDERVEGSSGKAAAQDRWG